MPNFTNRKNELVRTIDGREVWLSRPCAVVMHVIIVDKAYDQLRCLVVKRGAACRKLPGNYCLPCGYIDMDETSGMAAIRETWEETGLDIKAQLFDNSNIEVIYDDTGDDDQSNPWFVMTHPITDPQSIVMHHGIIAVLHDGDLPELHPQTAMADGEVEGAFWVSAGRFLSTEFNVCFDHRIWYERFVDRSSGKVAPYMGDTLL